MINQSAEKAARVVLVDDSEIALTILEGYLSVLGWDSIRAFTRATDAIDFLSSVESEPELIVLDLQMPEMDGVEFMQELSRLSCSAAIVISSATHHSVLKVVDEAARLRGLNYLGMVPKPIDLDIFREMLAGIRTTETPSRQFPRESVGLQIDVKDLVSGINNDEFVAYFQPKIDLETKKIVGAEALVRWKSSLAGLIPPIKFIGLAEKYDLIDELTERVVNQAMGFQAKASEALQRPMKVAINLSMKSLNSSEWPNRFRVKLAEHERRAEDFILELTESHLTSYSAEVLDALSRLRIMNLGLSIDDFGTGYSTFEQLEKVPLTELKVDRSFVTRVSHRPRSQAIARSNVALAKELGLSSVAEGIESQDDWDFMQQLGTDVGQGYFMSPALPADDFVEWAKTWEAAQA